MAPIHSPPRGRRIRLAFALLALLTAGAAWRGAPLFAQTGHDHGAAADAHHQMTEAEMARSVADFYATHPVRGQAAPLAGDPADTVFISSFIMNGDGNTATQVDTVTILKDESVLFQWLGGLGHTTTSGTDPLDPQAGLLWDQPSNSAAPQYVHTFTQEGLFPFFCRTHAVTMKGAVRVLPAVGVVPLPGNESRLGFVAAPSPNPTTGRVAFRFALREAGRAVAEVFDVRGRRVARVLDEQLPAGTFGAVWDGKSEGGVAAAPGVYRLRLQLPGLSASRQVVVAR